MKYVVIMAHDGKLHSISEESCGECSIKHMLGLFVGRTGSIRHNRGPVTKATLTFNPMFFYDEKRKAFVKHGFVQDVVEAEMLRRIRSLDVEAGDTLSFSQIENLPHDVEHSYIAVALG